MTASQCLFSIFLVLKSNLLSAMAVIHRAVTLLLQMVNSLRTIIPSWISSCMCPSLAFDFSWLPGVRQDCESTSLMISSVFLKITTSSTWYPNCHLASQPHNGIKYCWLFLSSFSDLPNFTAPRIRGLCSPKDVFVSATSSHRPIAQSFRWCGRYSHFLNPNRRSMAQRVWNWITPNTLSWMYLWMLNILNFSTPVCIVNRKSPMTCQKEWKTAPRPHQRLYQFLTKPHTQHKHR